MNRSNIFPFHLQICTLPEHEGTLKDLVSPSIEDLATSNKCKDHNSLKSTNFVVLFESSNLVGNLVKALRYKGKHIKAFL